MGDSFHKEVILKTNGLSKKFGMRWAAKDLNLEVHRGDIFWFSRTEWGRQKYDHTDDPYTPYAHRWLD